MSKWRKYREVHRVEECMQSASSFEYSVYEFTMFLCECQRQRTRGLRWTKHKYVSFNL